MYNEGNGLAGEAILLKTIILNIKLYVKIGGGGAMAWGLFVCCD